MSAREGDKEDPRANDRRMGLTEGARRKRPEQQAGRRAAGPHSQPPFFCPENWPWDWCSVIVFHQQTHRCLSVLLQEPCICKKEARCHLLEENVESPKPPAGSLGLPNLSSVQQRKVFTAFSLSCPVLSTGVLKRILTDVPLRPYSVISFVFLLERPQSFFLGPVAVPCCPAIPHFPIPPPRVTTAG